jgi:tetratricopeptide (TPR) repeat protein
MLDLNKALASWSKPKLPEDFDSSEIALANWLYDFIRANVKRGRLFQLEEVIASRRADCLGYAKLLKELGAKFGLDLGIVEVLIDTLGNYVPHYVNLLNLSNGTYHFIDLWYASKDINHRRIAAFIDGKLQEISREELPKVKHIRGLPQYCLSAIDFYILGNQFLERDELDKAIEYYSKAIEKYPLNTRAFYNRALAFERKGEVEKARADYRQAFKDEDSLIRVLARVDELERLIQLDEKGIGEMEQALYLEHKGFKTGKEVGFGEISRKYQIPPEQVEEIISRVASVII